MAGSAASAVRLTCDELERASGCEAWVDVCKGWREGPAEETEPFPPTPAL